MRMDNDDIQGFLKDWDSEWESIPDDSGNEYTDIPDGKYQCTVNKVYIDRSKAGRMQLVWDLIVLNGSHKERHIWRYNGMESAENLKFLKQDIGRCGVNIAKVSDLPNNLQYLLDKIIEVTLKTKGEFQNCYINKMIAAGEYNEDNVPF